MIQRRKQVRLAFETLPPFGVVGDGVGQHLEGDLALQLQVARGVDLAHSALAQRGEDFAGAEPGAKGKGHAAGRDYAKWRARLKSKGQGTKEPGGSFRSSHHSSHTLS